MGLRPGHCYNDPSRDRAYTRIAVSVPRKNFIGAIPGLKTRQFNMGNSKKEFSHIVDLTVEKSVQIRDNAIEATRIAINRFLNKKIGKEGYFMRIRVYPFHILRENKQAQGAHADRIQKGMSHAFGKPIGRAIRVRPGQKIISILVDEQHIGIAKEALKRANAKMPAKLKILVGTDVKSIGTKPKTMRETAEEAPKEEAGKEAKKEGKQGAAGTDTKKEDAKQTTGGKTQAGKAPAGKQTAGKPEAKKDEKKK